jgi:hypothetical protein
MSQPSARIEYGERAEERRTPLARQLYTSGPAGGTGFLRLKAEGEDKAERAITEVPPLARDVSKMRGYVGKILHDVKPSLDMPAQLQQLADEVIE